MAPWKKDWFRLERKKPHRNGAPKHGAPLLVPHPMHDMARSLDPRRVLTVLFAITAAAAYCFLHWKGTDAPLEGPSEKCVIDPASALAEPAPPGFFTRAITSLGEGIMAALSRSRK